MVVAFVRSHVPESVKSAGTTDAYALTSLVPADNLLVATLVHDNAASANTPTITSISKPAGETASWVLLGAARYPNAVTTGAYANGELWAIKTTVDWPNATSLTVTYSNSITMKAQNILEFSGAEATLRAATTVATAYSTTTTAASASTSGTAAVDDLAVGFLFGSNVAAAQAGSTHALGGAWSSPIGVGSTGGNATTNNFGVAQYKIMDAASFATMVNSAAMTAGNGAIVAVLRATPPPTVTQAAYRLYEDGTEATSAALSAQDTAPTVSIGGGDVNLALRIRLQETGVGPVAAADNDFQLQCERNSSGTWTDVSPPIMLVDTFTTGAPAMAVLSTAYPDVGQTFLGNGRNLARMGFWLQKDTATTGTVTAELWSHTGPFGTNQGRPTTLLQSSTTTLEVGALPATAQWVYFDFDGTHLLANGTAYAVVLATEGLNGYVRYGDVAGAGATHPGVYCYTAESGVWTSLDTQDTLFEVYTDSPAGAVAPYDSLHLTDGQATTQRLTGGTGTFQPGKVSEDGLVDNLGWLTGNHTEVLYLLALKADVLAAADTLRFRVLRNSSPLNSYTQTPTINVINVPVAPTASFTASSSSIKTGDTVTFTDISTGRPTSWVWNFGAGASPATASTKGPHTVTYTTPGTSTVTLTATNATGSDAADPTSITVIEGAPKIETLVDTFDTEVDKAVKWRASSTQVVWDAGRAKIPSTTSYYSLSTPTTGGYRLTDSSVMIQFTPPVGTNRESFMEILGAGASTNKISFYVSGTTLYARQTLNGSNIPVRSAPYDPVAHAWWRIRESLEQLYWETSPDGLEWTLFIDVGAAWTPDNVWLSINSGYYSTGTVQNAFVDNVNAPPAPEVPDGRPKVWTGSSWVKQPVQVWTRASWETKPMKVWTGSDWKLL